MMRGVPALISFIPLKHGEVGDPKQAKVAMGESAVTLGVFLAQGQA